MNTRKLQNSRVLVMMLAVIMVLSMMPSMAFATNFDNDHDRISIGTGEPVYIQWDEQDSSKGTVKAANEDYYPETFTMYVQNAAKVPEVTSGTGTVTYAYDVEEGNKAYVVSLSTAATIKVTLNAALENSGVYTLTCSAPAGSKPTAALPTAVNGYLPIGQYASGKAWGSIFSDGYNFGDNIGTIKKFLNGYSATGVSLGAAGGYVDFDFEARNDSTNPYGVDFIVYGNAFNGNPEAASVKVFGYTKADKTDGGKWYELAGSLYFDDLTQRNKDVSYKKVEGEGIYYQITNHGAELDDNGWTKFNSNTATAWWPEDSEGYNNTWGNVDDVVRNGDIITYQNISVVKDTDTTSHYQFGYADVHINGSNYGTAANPYTISNTAQGGDGFDLAWAVDENGNTVSLDHITKVRVYTSAAMKADGSGIFTVPGIFGETSAEVCSIYGVNGTGDGAAKKPTIKRGNATISTTPGEVKEVSVTAGTHTISITSRDSGDSVIYVNGNKIDNGSVDVTVASGETKGLQIIVQNGTKSPYVTMVKLIGN